MDGANCILIIHWGIVKVKLIPAHHTDIDAVDCHLIKLENEFRWGLGNFSAFDWPEIITKYTYLVSRPLLQALDSGGSVRP